jgi:four helix bundle protein
MNYKKFEELPCWQLARELCKSVFELINISKIKKDFSLRDQMWRSAGSTMDNIAEGFDDRSTPEFIRFLGYSQRSCSELKAVVDMKPVFEAQSLSYLELTGKRLGFLVNFNVPVIKNGIKRMIL